MPGKRVIRISVFQSYSGEVCLVSTAMAKKGRTPRDSKYVPIPERQVKRFAGMLNELAIHNCGAMYAHPACGFVWHR